MNSGYCFVCESSLWRTTPDESWGIEVYAPNGAEERVGARRIDGARCVVFACPDGKVRAQTAVSVGDAMWGLP